MRYQYCIYTYIYTWHVKHGTLFYDCNPNALTLPPTDLKKAKLQAQSKAPAKRPPDDSVGFHTQQLWESKGISSSVNPPRNKALWRDSKPPSSPNKAFLRPYLLGGGGIEREPLNSHEKNRHIQICCHCLIHSQRGLWLPNISLQLYPCCIRVLEWPGLFPIRHQKRHRYNLQQRLQVQGLSISKMAVHKIYEFWTPLQKTQPKSKET